MRVLGNGALGREKFSIFSKCNEKCTILDRNFAIFAKLLKFYQFFTENLGKNFEKFRNIPFYGLEASEFIKVFLENFMETGHLLKFCRNFERISFIQMQI